MFCSLEICVEGGDEAVLGVFAELPLRPPDFSVSSINLAVLMFHLFSMAFSFSATFG